jgi:pyruvate/2-oxoglutarate dehydrogenase complex dihydrolipoamide acyltransferase (E2) component
MPALEMAQETGKLLSWRKKEGEAIAKGEPLLDVETDKAVVEIESPADGFLAGVKAHAGDVIPVGQTIAWIVNAGENPPPQAGAWTASPLPPPRPRQILPLQHPLRLHRAPGFLLRRGVWRVNMGLISLACAGLEAKAKFWLRIFLRLLLRAAQRLGLRPRLGPKTRRLKPAPLKP